MSEDHQAIQDQTMADLFSGIVVDLQQLAEQQLQLMKSEVDDELRQRASSTKIVLCMIAVLFLAAINLSFGFAYFLHSVSGATGIESGGLPLWVCHFSVALILICTAGLLALLQKSRQFPPWFRREVVPQATKEIV